MVLILFVINCVNRNQTSATMQQFYSVVSFIWTKLTELHPTEI